MHAAPSSESGTGKRSHFVLKDTLTFRALPDGSHARTCAHFLPRMTSQLPALKGALADGSRAGRRSLF